MEIFAIMCLSYLWIYSEPTILLRRFLGFKEEDYFDYNKVKKFLHRLLYCTFCMAFWIGLCLSWSVYTAAIVSIGSLILEKSIERI